MNDRRVIQPEALETLRTTVIDLFADKQFHRVGIREICAIAGVSPQTVYKYFGNKQELLLGCVEQDLEELLKISKEVVAGEETPREKLRAIGDAHFRFYANNPTIARIIFLNLPHIYWMEHKSKAQVDFEELHRNILLDLAAESTWLQPNNVIVAQDVMAGGFARVIIRWLLSNGEIDINDMADQYNRVLASIIGPTNK